MDPQSDRVSALVKLYRGAIEPPPGTLERQHARVLARAAAGPSPPIRRPWRLAAAAAGLVLALSALGLYIEARVQRAVDASLAERTGEAATRSGAARLQAAPDPSRTIEAAPDTTRADDPSTPAPPDAPTSTTDAALAADPVSGPALAADPGPVSDPAPTRRRRDAPIDADSLRLEGVLLSQARDALARGEWARVLELVDVHRRRHPHGVLLEERLVLEAAAACEAGRTDRGRRALRSLERRFPGSLALSRVEQACAGVADE